MDSRADTPPDRLVDLPEPASPPLDRDPSLELGTEALEPVAPPEPGWDGSDALSEFPTESEAEEAGDRDGRPDEENRLPLAESDLLHRLRSVKAAQSWSRPTFALPATAWPVAAGVVLLALIAAAAWRWWPARGPAPVESGTVAIETTPSGASVAIDGKDRGKTPLSVSLPAGTHTVVLTAATGRRELPVTVVPGTQVVHHVELVEAAAPPKAGRLQIPAPAGAPIVLDGVRRGVAPAELADVPPGEHSVTVGEGAAAVTQRVSVPAGGLASLLVPLAQPRGQAAPAWVSIVSPIELQVFDGEVLIGNSTTDRILLLAGRHTLNLVNADLGYRAPKAVVVEAGRVAAVKVDVPNGVLDVNATPWAEVLVDGRRVGETPLANLAVPIGAHEVTLRNPKYPEQKRSVVVSLVGPTRVGVDLRQ